MAPLVLVFWSNLGSELLFELIVFLCEALTFFVTFIDLFANKFLELFKACPSFGIQFHCGWFCSFAINEIRGELF